ncbi:CoA ester lyase [Lampropedia puyangensis]|uniref:CoA ester lyase n=1 Tax=Lampropedia puyangensis TaxID=1330072 RepID=A0A4S8ET68_9BURK|nr:CoA ester lyase [Lampropedia puyangensis]THT97568.1 CoA ester lyase [Lampropedia puyangensis]
MSSLTSALAQARSLLFVPGTKVERFAKALASGADAIVLDLEDAVPPSEKDTARQAIAGIANAISAAPVPVVVRINTLGSALGLADTEWLQATPAIAHVMVPKTEQAQDLSALHQRLPNLQLIALIETALGLHHVHHIAAAPGVARLAVGHIDFLADLGMQVSTGEPEIAPLRFNVAMATRLANLPPAIDGVTADFQNDELLRQDTQRAIRYGFGGKLCIHPRQIEGVHTCFMPDAQQLQWAQRVVQADAQAQGAAVQLDGKMVDLPVVLQAQRILARLPQHTADLNTLRMANTKQLPKPPGLTTCTAH